MATETLTLSAADIGRLHNDLAYRLGAMLKAAYVLADHQRVHRAIWGLALLNPTLDATLTDGCVAFNNPGCDGDDDELMNLLKLARDDCIELAERLEDLFHG